MAEGSGTAQVTMLVHIQLDVNHHRITQALGQKAWLLSSYTGKQW